jgi:hypothetical protein
MEIDWPAEFGTWLDSLEERAASGDERADLLLDFVTAELGYLQALIEVPTKAAETMDLRWVRQSRRYELWRVSHAYHPDVAMRLICWFPPDSETVVVTLFGGDKARIGDVWYDSVANRADGLIDQWKREACHGQGDA